MFIKISNDGQLYRQVYESLRESILAGRLKPGARLPSTRSLAREIGLSRNTVMLAYDQLMAEGYLTGQIGSGTYVAAQLPDEMLCAHRPTQNSSQQKKRATARLSAFGERLAKDLSIYSSVNIARQHAIRWDFRYGLPSVAEFPHEIWRRLLARRARAASLRTLNYGSAAGYQPLREALADYLRRHRAVACDAEQILIVNGSQQAIDLIARVLLDPGDRVIIEEPHYQGARKILQAIGARLIAVDVDNEGLITSHLPTARFAYITPSHQFPTGAVMSLTRRLALLAWAENADAYLVEDDYDSEYRYDGRPIEAVQGLDRAERVIYVGTFSKVLFPSLRVGYLVLPKSLIEIFTAAKWLSDRHTATLEQEVLADFIREGHFERHLRRSRARNAARRNALLAALTEHLGDSVEISGANAGIHLLIWLKGVTGAHNIQKATSALIERAEQAGIGIYSIAPYYLNPPNRVGLIIGYAALTEREIRAGIKRLAALL
jgi:GntR family transcriptional regulator/MocR family aminotransferase